MCCGGDAVASAASVSQQYRMAHLASVAEVVTEFLAVLSPTPNPIPIPNRDSNRM